MKKGQGGLIVLVVGVLCAFIGLILTQALITPSMANWTTAGGNGTLIGTIVGYFVPLLAVGLLVTIVAVAIGRGR